MSESIPASLPLRNDLIGEEPYGAPQLDVPGVPQRQREPVRARPGRLRFDRRTGASDSRPR